MVAKLVIFNGINEQCQNIFVFLYNFLRTFATTKIQIYNSSIMIRSLIIVALGGGMGSALRFLASKFVQDNMAGIFPYPTPGGQCYRLPAHRHFLRIVVARQSGWRLCQTPPHHRPLRWLHHILHLLQREPLADARRPRLHHITIYRRQHHAGIHCRGCRVLDCGASVICFCS